jgi:hypothetical protein
VTRVTAQFVVPPISHGTNGTVSCPANQRVVGGGFEVAEPLAEWTQTYSSFPSSDDSWKVRLGNAGQNHALPVTVFALCVAG